MPSGARKRRAARRKKAHEEQLRAGVLSPTAFPGNLEIEEDDLSSEDGRQSESSCSELLSPISFDDHRHHLVAETDEQIKSPVGEASLTEKTEIAGNGKREEHSVSQNGKNEIEIGEALLLSTSRNGPDSPKYDTVPVSDSGSTNVEHKLEKVECSVPLSEHAVQEDFGSIEIVAESNKCEEGMSLSSLRNESGRKVEVKDQSLKLKNRSTLMSCCGLFDVFAGGSRKKSV